MTDNYQQEIECLARIRKDQMTIRLKNLSSTPQLLHLIAELLISIDYQLNRTSKL